MTIDYNTYDYVQLHNHKNIVAQVNKGATTDAKLVHVSEFLKPVIFKVALDNPDWLLVAPVTGNVKLQSFEVYADGEELGTITSKRRWRPDAEVYAIKSPRIVKQRGPNETWTIKEKIALKTIKEYFRPSSDNEIIEKTRLALAGKVNNIQWDARETFINFVKDNKQSLAQFFRAYRDNKSIPVGFDIDKFLSLSDNEAAAVTLYRAFSNAMGVCVHMRGGKRILSAERPMNDDFLTKLAMLKLANDEQLVPDAGYRLDANRFFVLDTVK